MLIVKLNVHVCAHILCSGKKHQSSMNFFIECLFPYKNDAETKSKYKISNKRKS